MWGHHQVRVRIEVSFTSRHVHLGSDRIPGGNSQIRIQTGKGPTTDLFYDSGPNNVWLLVLHYRNCHRIVILKWQDRKNLGSIPRRGAGCRIPSCIIAAVGASFEENDRTGN